MFRTLLAAAWLTAALPSAWAFDDQPVVDWVASHAVRIETPEAGHGFADLQPLKKVIGNARIVSLGEATHGSREFFQLKHRMLEFLASEMGFTIFSIEANMPEAYKLNDYVLTGDGDPAALIKGMYFWTWDTEEVLAMVRWMREFNKSGKGRVEFTGFDMQTPNVAAAIVRKFVERADPDYAAAFKPAYDIALAPARPVSSGGNFGVATAQFPVKEAAGKRVRFSGWIKTENITRGYAGLWFRVDGAPTDGAPHMLAFDNMRDRGVTGTTDWKRYEIELAVAADARNINFGAILPGDGAAWFDGFTVELDEKPYADDTAFDLDFESASPRGFYTGGNGYQVQLDTAVFHSGKQSLRMKYAGAPPSDEKAVDPRVVADAWKDVMAHLEASREAYAKKEAAAREIDWAVQNARVVLQCMQMRSNEVTRDRSMADNIKWILDHSPRAKIVLWAHNGHVTAKSVGSYEPMGAALRKIYGDQMVVFGFAFNQGSFQARSQQNRELKDFTVPPAPEGSLDATLAATKIPLFALDLRPAPKGGPVSAWLAEPHKTRSIGAIYPEGEAYAYMTDLKASDCFDAILFVEKPTAARKNQ